MGACERVGALAGRYLEAESVVTGVRAVESRVCVRVPSKVNLFLAVRGLRSDGMHEVVTVMQTVSVTDTIVAELVPSANVSHPAARRLMSLAFALAEPSDVPSDESNLALQAARRLMDATGIGTAMSPRAEVAPTTRLHLTKSIPVAAGMAGGSADAAATLVALNELWETGLNRGELADIGAQLGADVPFCVSGGTALATGTGTATAQVLTRGVFHWVIGISDAGLSTPEVYATFDDIAEPSDVEPDVVFQALRTGDAEALGASLYNDLEQAALHLRPDLQHAKQAMLDAGALGALVSGSGPTLMALARSPQEAVRIAATVRAHFARVECAMSPAGGPEIF